MDNLISSSEDEAIIQLVSHTPPCRNIKEGNSGAIPTQKPPGSPFRGDRETYSMTIYSYN